MISIQYKNNFSKKYKDLQDFYKVNDEALIITANKAGSFMMTKVRNYIETAGNGHWSETHPLTFQGSKETAYHWLGKMARYKIHKQGQGIEIGFGQFTARDVRKGKDLNFDKKLSKVSTVMQLGKKFRTSKRMQRKLGSARKNAFSIPGKDFFPIRNTTKYLEIPARPVMKPILKKYKNNILEIYKKKYKIILKKGFERL